MNFVSWKFWNNFELKTTHTQNILFELITKRSRKVFMLVIKKLLTMESVSLA